MEVSDPATVPTRPTPIPAAPAEAPSKAGAKRVRLLAFAAIVLGTAGYFGYQWWAGRGFETSDNAQVEGHITPVLPRVAGYVTQVMVEENDTVSAGDTLLVIDDRDAREKLAMAEANLAAAVASVNAGGQESLAAAQTATAESQAGALDAQAGAVAAQSGVVGAQADAAAAQAAAAQASVAQAVANAEKARRDVERYTPLVERQIVSRQQYDAAVATAAAAQAQVAVAREQAAAARASAASARAQIGAVRGNAAAARGNAAAARAGIGTARAGATNAQARVSTARAQVAAAESAVEQARLQVTYNVVVAPSAGVVSHRNVEVGQYLQAGTPVMAVTPTTDVWVTANLKETQVARVRVGSPVHVSVDAYPGLDLDGRVESLSPATGAEFSMLPPDNATGNFTKVVQRIPVRIHVAAPDRQHPLRPGMSAEVRIDTRG